MIDLTAFQQNCLLLVAASERQDDQVPHGLAIKSRLEDVYSEEVNHGRLYPNLDELVEQGFLTKSERDKRTNAYSLTDRGLEAINDFAMFAKHALGEDVPNPYVSSQDSQAPADD